MKLDDLKLDIYTERLMKLATVVRTGDRELKMELWTNYCRTSCCAFGDYCLSNVGVSRMEIYGVSGEVVPVYRDEKFAASVGLDAACLEFNINFNQASWLFLPVSYGYYNPSRAEVADRIEDFIHNRKDYYDTGSLREAYEHAYGRVFVGGFSSGRA